MRYFVERVNDLNALDIGKLVQESEKEGYRFVTRLVSEFEDGTNTFSKPGEALFCVVSEEGEVVAIGGINESPFAQDAGIARLRRFYVLEKVRRQGVGTLLQQEIVDYAKNQFKEITVRTDSAKADAFYRACGFEFDDSASETTHILRFR
ncbi:GNAT family N-acetyltransferase [Sporosarcina highlanderae]|uniref:GNAT family N-acetyltransferase n=1 Tax=Sporosarcina highlanderae TaxID=3035916 RepID=A0ABT8JSH4_9BACL|nr:GNAT family N-acetyltransferase [Sporosarcina highlanderae]MDN4607867.1 GNAT family N-acetyltransferase [Sporosarcina highlanderae]